MNTRFLEIEPWAKGKPIRSDNYPGPATGLKCSGVQKTRQSHEAHPYGPIGRISVLRTGAALQSRKLETAKVHLSQARNHYSAGIFNHQDQPQTRCRKVVHGMKPIHRDVFDSFPCSKRVRHFNPGSTSLTKTISSWNSQLPGLIPNRVWNTHS